MSVALCLPMFLLLADQFGHGGKFGTYATHTHGQECYIGKQANPGNRISCNKISNSMHRMYSSSSVLFIKPICNASTQTFGLRLDLLQLIELYHQKAVEQCKRKQ